MQNKTIVNRLKRLSGQLEKLQKDIDNNKDCAEIVPQFLAVKGAVIGAYEEYIKCSLDHCKLSDSKKAKQLISMLVKA